MWSYVLPAMRNESCCSLFSTPPPRRATPLRRPTLPRATARATATAATRRRRPTAATVRRRTARRTRQAPPLPPPARPSHKCFLRSERFVQSVPHVSPVVRAPLHRSLPASELV